MPGHVLSRSSVLIQPLLLLAACLLPGLRAQDAPPAPPPVAVEVERVAGLLQQGDLRLARSVLLELLRREGPDGGLGPHVARLDALLREIQFGLAFKAPGPRDLPGGHVVKWSEASGSITLRYERESTALELPSAAADPLLRHLDRLAEPPVVPVLMLPTADHVLAGSAVLVHRADFGPEWALEIKGDLPEDECNVVPHVFLCVESGSFYDLALTWPRYTDVTSSINGLVIEGRQGNLRRLVEGVPIDERVDPNPIEKYGMKKRRSYAVVVKLRPDEIFFSINGVAGPRFPRDPAAGGLIGYTSFPGVTSIEIAGRADRAWLDGLAQARRAQARAAFDAEPPVDRAVPPWWAGLVAAAAPPDG